MMEFLEKNWALVAANPLPFIVLFCVSTSGAWLLAYSYFSDRLAAARERTELAVSQRDEFRSKLAVSNPDEAKTKIDRLEGEVAGLNRIFAVTIGHPWKPLADREVDDLANRLAGIEKHRVQIMYMNQLGKDLAQSFFKAFQKAGWTGATLSGGGGVHSGIIAGAGANKAGQLKTAIEASTPYKIELDKPTVEEWGDVVYLFVGLNPEKVAPEHQ
ncbi:hypothetical protein RPD_1699 [Rhodopseudomonas palustris BisB5]|uniref:Uncharacterized protein n=1 Tax=Rhodopseudomonas palustris (strain BisB5) TaxID=316057 RepID=Q13AF4_RHOPS|nr:hypothetical protein RPD_1699 [Rhodopseudomonas palustris BisB5]